MVTSSTQQKDVVQAIFDSVTRCFNPIDVECPDSTGTTATQKKTSATSTTATGGRRSGSSGSGTETTGATSSSTQNNNTTNNDLKSKYDADRYIHRKLEIFRTTSEELAELGIERRGNGNNNKRQQGQGQGNPNGKNSRRRGTKSANTLVCSTSDEIDNLTKSHKRDAAIGYGCHGTTRCNVNDMGDDQEDQHPIFSFAKLLRDPFNCLSENVQKPFMAGLCFATPIREGDDEDIGNMSAWKLTAEEFAARQRRLGLGPKMIMGKALNCGTCADDDMVPDVDLSEASLEDDDEEDEEETITSASYFDQKYSHIVEENPPMPLFREQRILVSEFEKDEIFKMIKRRELAGSAGVNGSSGGRNNSGVPRIPGAGDAKSGTGGPRRSPTDHIIVKNMVKKNNSSSTANANNTNANNTNTTPKMASRKSWRNKVTSKSHRRSSSRSSKNYNNDSSSDPVPVGKSSSVSDDGPENNSNVVNVRRWSNNRTPQKNRLREPDIVYSTAAI